MIHSGEFPFVELVRALTVITDRVRTNGVATDDELRYIYELASQLQQVVVDLLRPNPTPPFDEPWSVGGPVGYNPPNPKGGGV